MKNSVKFTLLFIVIGVPLIIYTFLKFFGQNEYKLPLMNPTELKVYNMKALNCTPNEIEGVHRIPSFSFTGIDSANINQDLFNDKVYVAEFFFTTCPDICIVMTSELHRVQERFKNEKDFMILSHSVDPVKDTPEVLKAYAKDYNINTDMWKLVTGEKNAIYEQARCGYFVTAKPEESDSTDFIHSDKLILVDKENRIRGFYSGTDREDVDRLVTEISLLLKEYE